MRHGLAVRTAGLIAPSHAARSMNGLAILEPYSYVDTGSTPDALS